MWTIFKVFIEFVTILLLFYVLVYGPQACGILTPQPGIELSLPALEGRVLTTGPPGKSLHLSLSLAFASLYQSFLKLGVHASVVLAWFFTWYLNHCWFE